VRLRVRDYLQTVLGTPDSIDYDVRDAGNRPIATAAGLHRGSDGTLVDDVPLDDTPLRDRDDASVEGFAVIHRSGGLSVPVEIEARFADGSTQRHTIPGTARHVTLTWPGRRLERVVIDPEGALLLEQRRWDNVRYVPGVRGDVSLDDTAGDLAEAAALVLLVAGGP
jgi:hypothetical protein